MLQYEQGETAEPARRRGNSRLLRTRQIMLSHPPQDTENDSGATTEELTAALEALHDRRRLVLPDVTPQEIRAEVQTQRERWRTVQARRSQ